MPAIAQWTATALTSTALGDMPEVGGVLLTPSHQFPLGVSLHSDRRAAVIDWARRTGGVIIEDDYDGEFRYDRSPVGALHGGDPDHVIYMGTASKSLAPGLRLGWLVVPDRLVDAVARQKGETEETSVSSTSWRWPSSSCRAPMTDTFAPCVPSTGAGANNSSPPSPAASPTTTVTGMPAGLHVMLELAGGDESALSRQRAWRRLGVEGLDLYRHPETDSRARRFGDRVRIACAERMVGGLGRLDRTAALTVAGPTGPFSPHPSGPRRPRFRN